MNTQTLGRTSLRVSRLSYGCMRTGSVSKPNPTFEDAIESGRASVLAAYEAGYTLFDHADIYGGTACEQIFGKVLAEVPEMRERIVIATKCGVRFQGDTGEKAPHRFDLSGDYILQSCEGSLHRLGVETIDVYQLHRPDYLMHPEEVARAFTLLQEQGKVRAFGVSNFRPSLVAALQSACPMPLAVNQVEIHLGRLDCLEDGTLDQCLADGITPLAWSPLGGGFLGDGGRPHQNDPRREGLESLLALMDEMAGDYGITRSLLALAWLLKHPAGIIPIVGTHRPERIRETARALEVDLSREDWYRLTTAARMNRLP